MGHNTYITNTENNDTHEDEIVFDSNNSINKTIEEKYVNIVNKWNKVAKVYNLTEVSSYSKTLTDLIDLRLQDKIFDLDKILEKIKSSARLRGCAKGQKKKDAITLMGLLKSEKLFTAILNGAYDEKDTKPSLMFKEAYGNKRIEFVRELKDSCQQNLGFSNIDGNYYYAAVSTWSEKNNKYSANWVAEGQNFINRDYNSKDGDRVKYEKIENNGIRDDYGTS